MYNRIYIATLVEPNPLFPYLPDHHQKSMLIDVANIHMNVYETNMIYKLSADIINLM